MLVSSCMHKVVRTYLILWGFFITGGYGRQNNIPSGYPGQQQQGPYGGNWGGGPPPPGGQPPAGMGPPVSKGQRPPGHYPPPRPPHPSQQHQMMKGGYPPNSYNGPPNYNGPPAPGMQPPPPSTNASTPGYPPGHPGHPGPTGHPGHPPGPPGSYPSSGPPPGPHGYPPISMFTIRFCIRYVVDISHIFFSFQAQLIQCLQQRPLPKVGPHPRQQHLPRLQVRLQQHPHLLHQPQVRVQMVLTNPLSSQLFRSHPTGPTVDKRPKRKRHSNSKVDIHSIPLNFPIWEILDNMDPRVVPIVVPPLLEEAWVPRALDPMEDTQETEWPLLHGKDHRQAQFQLHR